MKKNYRYVWGIGEPIDLCIEGNFKIYLFRLLESRTEPVQNFQYRERAPPNLK
jgi:hypothetical protein